MLKTFQRVRSLQKAHGHHHLRACNPARKGFQAATKKKRKYLAKLDMVDPTGPFSNSRSQLMMFPPLYKGEIIFSQQAGNLLSLDSARSCLWRHASDAGWFVCFQPALRLIWEPSRVVGFQALYSPWKSMFTSVWGSTVHCQLIHMTPP